MRSLILLSLFIAGSAMAQDAAPVVTPEPVVVTAAPSVPAPASVATPATTVPPVTDAAVPAPVVAQDGALTDAATVKDAALVSEVPSSAPVVTTTINAVPETEAEVVATLDQLVAFVKAEKWSGALGVLIMLLVWFLRTYKLLEGVPNSVIPWVAVGLGLLTAVGLALMAGQPWDVALIAGIGSGVMAPALWELIFKHFVPKGPTDSPPAAPPSSET